MLLRFDCCRKLVIAPLTAVLLCFSYYYVAIVETRRLSPKVTAHRSLSILAADATASILDWIGMWRHDVLDWHVGFLQIVRSAGPTNQRLVSF